MAGDMGPPEMVGADGHRLEVGPGEGGSAGGSERGRSGDDGIGIGLGTITHAGRDRGRHRGGGVPGDQWTQWSGAEWGRRMSKQAGTLSMKT